MMNRSLFKRQVYLDNNATTHVNKRVRREMLRVLKYNWGNPSSGYYIGKRAARVIEKARQQVADAINAHSHEIYFTGCATESNNTVINSIVNHFFPGKKKIISTPIEHPSVINSLEYMQSSGVIVQYCSVDKNGFISMEELESLIDDDTFLICCMLASNELGTIQNMKAVTTLAKSHNIQVLCDCVQALGKIPVNVKEMGVDYATFSAHKLYGPKGVGALYARISSPLEPLIHGGHQESGMRAGTESTHNIAGFGIACRDIKKQLSGAGKVKALKDQLKEGLIKIKPDIIINSPVNNCLPNTLNVTFPGVNNRELMMMLDYNGISVSSGSACGSQQSKPSHVLKAIGLSDKEAGETIRISLGVETSASDIRYTLKIFSDYLKNSNM